MSFKKYLDEKEMMEKNDDTKDKIFDFFIANPNPTDSDIRGMVQDLGIEHDKFETITYSILSDFLPKGLSKGQEVEDNPLMSQAIEIEKEHTSNPRIAKKIAADHVYEHGWRYYEELIKMEDMLENEAGIKESKQEVLTKDQKEQMMKDAASMTGRSWSIKYKIGDYEDYKNMAIRAGYVPLFK